MHTSICLLKTVIVWWHVSHFLVLANLNCHLTQPSVVWQSLNWGIVQIILTCDHVFGRLSQLLIDVFEPLLPWKAPSGGRWDLGCIRKLAKHYPESNLISSLPLRFLLQVPVLRRFPSVPHTYTITEHLGSFQYFCLVNEHVPGLFKYMNPLSLPLFLFWDRASTMHTRAGLQFTSSLL